MYLDEARPLPPASLAANAERLREAIRRTGMKRRTRISRRSTAFTPNSRARGCRCNSSRPAVRRAKDYPTYRDLLLETDRRGRQLCYLASEDDFQFVKGLEARDLIVPVVGNLAGSRALAAIGQDIGEYAAKRRRLDISNIENDLFRDAAFRGSWTT